MQKVIDAYICPVPTCPRVFINGNGLKVHILRMHMYQTSCPLCGVELSSLKKHLLHSPDPMHIALYSALPCGSHTVPNFKVKIHELMRVLKVKSIEVESGRGGRLTADINAKTEHLRRISHTIESMMTVKGVKKFSGFPAKTVIMSMKVTV